jgi:hypothetical protein
MTTSTAHLARNRHHGFQFRIGTLLVAMAWAGLVSLGLRTPTALWSGVIAVLTLLTVLMAVLFVIYRTGRTRATAIGFLVFGVGYLAYLAILAGTLSAGLSDPTTPVGAAFDFFYNAVHPLQNVHAPMGGMAGMPGWFVDASGVGGLNGYGGTGDVLTSRAPAFDRRDFIAICNHALACLLGVAGAIAAQVLYATRRNEPQEPS